ncbi:MAG: glycosyltransferase family 1 protein, partial [Paludibacteraceae bacterium]|nr:glycosyltransferase family 1 protein [Paludibacteraceae bacterium]
LITPGDIDSLVDRLYQLIINPDMRKKFSEESYNLISSNFSIDNNISELKDVYFDLLSPKD